jgi:hypothetical protein
MRGVWPAWVGASGGGIGGVCVNGGRLDIVRWTEEDV